MHQTKLTLFYEINIYFMSLLMPERLKTQTTNYRNSSFEMAENKVKKCNLCMPASLVALQRFNRDTLS